MNYEFKVGDKVLLKNTWHTDIAIVDKITPTGLIKVGKMTFKPNGFERGGDRWHPYQIIPLSEDDEKEFYDKKYIHKVYNALQEISKEKISIEQAVQINQILKLNIDFDKSK